MPVGDEGVTTGKDVVIVDAREVRRGDGRDFDLCGFGEVSPVVLGVEAGVDPECAVALPPKKGLDEGGGPVQREEGTGESDPEGVCRVVRGL